MKCHGHEQADAVAACVHCGVGLCRTCLARSPAGRAVCSSRCAEISSELELALRTVREKTLTSSRFAGRFLIGGGAVFLGFGVYELTHRGFLRPALFLCGLSLVFLVAGVGQLRMLAKQS